MMSRSESAVKIQAAFRGFIVRKYVRKLDVVRREVEEIERRFCEEETVELMRGDERERLNVNEALMSLLFRLDSVRGVDSGVRELRKKVIRKAIALQEKVDAIATVADLADRKEGGAAEVEQSEAGRVDSPDSPYQEGEGANAEQIEERVADSPDQEEGGGEAAQSEELVLDLPHQKKEGGAEAEHSEELVVDLLDQEEGRDGAEPSENRDIDLPDQEEGGAEAKQSENQVAHGSLEGSDHVVDNGNHARDLRMEMELPPSETSGESGTDPSSIPESFLEEVDENVPVKEGDEDEQAESSEEKEVEEADEENDGAYNIKNAGDDNSHSEKMLGRMLEDNEKMMGMLMQLFERNVRQMQLLSLLSQRVEQLEKAFLCEKMRRKKKRQAVDGERLLDSNKCGKKL